VEGSVSYRGIESAMLIIFRNAVSDAVLIICLVPTQVCRLALPAAS
jgi:hypothetical protein